MNTEDYNGETWCPLLNKECIGYKCRMWKDNTKVAGYEAGHCELAQQ